jgi:hypothetical protein
MANDTKSLGRNRANSRNSDRPPRTQRSSKRARPPGKKAGRGDTTSASGGAPPPLVSLVARVAEVGVQLTHHHGHIPKARAAARALEAVRDALGWGREDLSPVLDKFARTIGRRTHRHSAFARPTETASHARMLRATIARMIGPDGVDVPEIAKRLEQVWLLGPAQTVLPMKDVTPAERRSKWSLAVGAALNRKRLKPSRGPISAADANPIAEAVVEAAAREAGFRRPSSLFDADNKALKRGRRS